ncbi:hypothetical protein [Oceanobacillus sp. FSL H7-0719]|uniref:hypothetical protein n=1 Tax=Oceanobacillus sp. FSL H7-0719 TaxID=2954507 RepID=UPI003245FEAC
MKANEHYISENVISTNEMIIPMVDLEYKSLNEKEFEKRKKNVYRRIWKWIECEYRNIPVLGFCESNYKKDWV